LKDRQEFAKLTNGESLDMIRKREVWRRSYASLVSHPADENHTLGIAVSSTNQWMSHLTHMTWLPLRWWLYFLLCNFVLVISGC